MLRQQGWAWARSMWRPAVGRGQAVARAGMSTEALPAPTSLSVDQAVTSSRIVLDFVRYGVSGVRLETMNGAVGMDVHEKWTHALQVLVATQAHTATAFGYEPNSEGVMKYRQHLSAAAASAPAEQLAELKRLDQEVWEEVLLRGFALPPKTMTVEDARSFSAKVAAAVADEKGLPDDLAALVAAVPEGQDKQAHALKIVQRAVYDIQRQIAPDFGFDGDDGYVQIQCALVHHMSDPMVMHSTTTTMHAITNTARLT